MALWTEWAGDRDAVIDIVRVLDEKSMRSRTTPLTSGASGIAGRGGQATEGPDPSGKDHASILINSPEGRPDQRGSHVASFGAGSSIGSPCAWVGSWRRKLFGDDPVAPAGQAGHAAAGLVGTSVAIRTGSSRAGDGGHRPRTATDRASISLVTARPPAEDTRDMGCDDPNRPPAAARSAGGQLGHDGERVDSPAMTEGARDVL